MNITTLHGPMNCIQLIANLRETDDTASIAICRFICSTICPLFGPFFTCIGSGVDMMVSGPHIYMHRWQCAYLFSTNEVDMCGREKQVSLSTLKGKNKSQMPWNQMLMYLHRHVHVQYHFYSPIYNLHVQFANFKYAIVRTVTEMIYILQNFILVHTNTYMLLTQCACSS